MNYFSQNVTDQINQDLIRKLRISENEARLDYLEEIDDYFENKNADSDRSQKYFPRLEQELSEDYNRRLKVAIAWFPIFVKKALYYFWKGNTVYKWVDKEEAPEGQETKNQGLIDEANKLNQSIMLANNYDRSKLQWGESTLKYGETTLLPKFLKYDINTGKPFENGKGIVKWLEITPHFYNPIFYERFPDMKYGALLVYDFDGNKIHSIDTSIESKPDDRTRYIHLITQSLFDEATGKLIKPGVWRAWENEVEIKDSGPNKYSILPLCFWEYAESMLDKGKAMIENYNKMFTNYANALNMMGFPMLKQVGGTKPGNDIAIGPGRLLWVNAPADTAASIDTMSPQIQVEPYKEYFDRLEKYMGFVFSVPLEVVQGMADAQSGIQLKMLFASLIQLREYMTLYFRPNEENFMYRSMYILEVNTGMPGHYTDKLKPVVQYADNIIPTNEKEEMEMDIAKENQGWISKKQNLMKYNKDIKTEKQADEFLEERKEEAKEKMQEQADKLTAMAEEGPEKEPEEKEDE